jgi:hypothetical protein
LNLPRLRAKALRRARRSAAGAKAGSSDLDLLIAALKRRRFERSSVYA